jgi:hypothetical protein
MRHRTHCIHEVCSKLFAQNKRVQALGDYYLENMVIMDFYAHPYWVRSHALRDNNQMGKINSLDTNTMREIANPPYILLIGCRSGPATVYFPIEK